MIARGKRTAVALIALLLGAGGAMGIAIDRTWFQEAASKRSRGNRRGPPPHMTKRIFETFKQRLGLSPEQATAVRSILDSVEDTAKELHESSKPVMTAAMSEADDKIRALLNAEQRPIYEQLIEERQKRFERAGPGPRGPRRGNPMRHLDANGDGKLSRAEVEADTSGRNQRLLGRFSKIDTNSDGFLTRAELRDGRHGPR